MTKRHINYNVTHLMNSLRVAFDLVVSRFIKLQLPLSQAIKIWGYPGLK